MFDEDYYNGYTTTDSETETETETTSAYNPYGASTEYSADYDDDYSVTSNYTGEESYNSVSKTETQELEEMDVRGKMVLPTITQKEETVSLTKTKQRLTFSTRMKMIASIFAVIVASLLFVTVWNFASANQINSTLSSKQEMVNELNSSISSLQNEYVSYVSEDALRESAESAGYVYSDETNTFYVNNVSTYSEEVVEDLPSNWFNDFCNFLINLFN
ncbi:MAG: hypothetical protein IJ538_00955 [Clostridia bacterium]|nr:hypothetical protein [Clostridia bacterium]